MHKDSIEEICKSFKSRKEQIKLIKLIEFLNNNKLFGDDIGDNLLFEIKKYFKIKEDNYGNS